MNNIEEQIQELKLLANCVKISLDEVLKDDTTMKEAKKKLEAIILENHNYNIYYSESEKAWRTYLPDESKKSKRKPIKRSSKENLEKAIVEFYKEKQQQECRDNLTLEDLYKEWLIYRRDYTSAKDATIRKDTIEWNKFFNGSDLARMPVSEITPVVITRFFRRLTKDREYTRKRIINAKAVLNGIFYYAVEEQIVIHNPVLDVNFRNFSYKPVENQSSNVFTQEEAGKLLSYLETVIEPYSLAIQLSFNLFIRIGETKALKWENIDYDNRTIYLNSQVLEEAALNDDLSFSTKKKKVEPYIKGYTSSGYRKEYLTDRALEILEIARQLNPDGEFIFMPYGRLMTTDRFNIYMKRYCKQAGIPYRSSHKIRFYSASTAYDGTNLIAISKMMGHSQTATTIHYLRDVMQNNDMEQIFKNLGKKS